jgi:molybdopterin/thiamine biosynthesis adenylyltransferase
MQRTSRHIVVAGAGNTGSHLLPHLARMSAIGRITIVDPDVYAPENAASQNLDWEEDLGRAKAVVQAERLRRIRACVGGRALEVVAFQERIEDVPRGLLISDLIVSCLDSSRQYVNQIAWRLNVPWTDCGVQGGLKLARVNSYRPAMDAPCLECAWGPDDYAALEQEYPCGAVSGAAHPTLASSALGALAASLAAIEIAKLLSDDHAHALVGRQDLVDAEHHTLDVTTYRRNPSCRFDHHSWQVEPWLCPPAERTLGSALGAAGSLQVEGHLFSAGLICPSCEHREPSLRLNRPLAHCPICSRRLIVPGFGSFDRIDPGRARGYEDLTLAQIGLRAGDIVSDGSRRYRCITEAA